MSRALRLIASAASALLASSCGVLDARLKAETVCYTLPAYPIPAAPASGTDLTTRILYDLGSDLPIISEKGLTYALVLTRLELSPSADSPSVDLGGVDTLDVSALPPQGTDLPEVALVRYERGLEPHPAMLTAAPTSDADLAPYVAGGRLELLAEASGALPASAWAADVKACFVLTVDVEYADAR